ncbi:hypothetical protein LINGRAHAP2_LOCUS9850, partial [Linum grandiflorum]
TPESASSKDTTENAPEVPDLSEVSKIGKADVTEAESGSKGKESGSGNRPIIELASEEKARKLKGKVVGEGTTPINYERVKKPRKSNSVYVLNKRLMKDLTDIQRNIVTYVMNLPNEQQSTILVDFPEKGMQLQKSELITMEYPKHISSYCIDACAHLLNKENLERNNNQLTRLCFSTRI